jgi:transcriptional regulator with XRE-family HTH domain
MSSIAQRLLEAREKRDLSQAQVALLAGVSQGTIGNIEAGIRKSKGSLHSIAKALGVNLEWLMNGEGEMLASEHEIRIERPSEETPLSVSAIELGRMLDLIPVHDRLKRAKAYHAASAAILDILES